MITILESVGKNGRNLPIDVKKVQTLLNKNTFVTRKLAVDGKYGSMTFHAIVQFQMSLFRNARSCDGKVDPDGKTLQALNQSNQNSVGTMHPRSVRAHGRSIGGHAAVAPAPVSSSVGKLTEADFQQAANELGPDVEVAMIRAFAEVESGGKSGFASNGFPKIAFEGHIFRKYTNKVYDSTHPKLSYKYVTKAGPEWKENNKNDTKAQETLNAAAKLDRAAAYKACSWGMFQVMGFNYSGCGFGSVDAFVESMKAGESGQLKAFVGFCKSTPGLVTALSKKDYVKCATLYNGADYGDYDKRIEKAYNKYASY